MGAVANSKRLRYFGSPFFEREVFMSNWTVKQKRIREGAVAYISGRFQISQPAAEILINRGYNTEKAIDAYLNTSVDRLRPLAGMPQVKKSFEIIKNALQSNLPITIYGDYDVDGVTSTVILCKALRALGASVDTFIPDRHTDGYGMNHTAVKNIADKGCKLLITCDNGVASKEEIAFAKQLGMQVVVYDHHEPPFETADGEKRLILPDCDALVDMWTVEEDIPFRGYCAGGLCYKLMREFYACLGKPFELNDELAVFAALATVCDIMSLEDENRAIVRYGLELINKKVDNKGLKKLIDVNDIGDKPITEYTFGFIIGPCINAGGRLELAAYAAELFLTADEERRSELAQKLYELNSERKDMTIKAVERLSEQADNTTDRVLVLYDDGIDESIAGIVAGKIREHCNKPCIVLTKSSNDGEAKGSGRSMEYYDMFEELSAVKQYFTKFGGHKMAAGMSLLNENIAPLRKALNDNCTLTEKQLQRHYEADKIMTLDDATVYAAEDMELFRPYGNGNPEPLLALCGLTIKRLRFVGKEKNIASLYLSDSSGNSIAAVCFDGEKAEDMLNSHFGAGFIDSDHSFDGRVEGIKADFMAKLRVNEYNGNRSPQLIIEDMRISGTN